MPGISGFGCYFPPWRVDLESWCEWTNNPFEKIRPVVGTGFRICGPRENAYTMAATAVLRLLDAHEVSTTEVGMLAFGTESSTDNSAGAVIIKGMVNSVLKSRRADLIPRACEVPEFKHACLGGVYALKSALRYVATDGLNKLAIVVASDIAEYELGSSGEPTQGAGAVAMLVEAEPRILKVNLAQCANSSDYRQLDFRKPFSRYLGLAESKYGGISDFPVFNGKFSTSCYIEAVVSAASAYFKNTTAASAPSVDQKLRDAAAILLHRPYHRMAETGRAVIYLLGLVVSAQNDSAELERFCALAEVSKEQLIAELSAAPDLLELVAEGELSREVYPLVLRVVKAMRGDAEFAALWPQHAPQAVNDLGNLYTASLFAWLAATLEEVTAQNSDSGETSRDSVVGSKNWATGSLILVGYGSGDAAEILPADLVKGWQSHAAKTALNSAMADATELSQLAYRNFHERQVVNGDPADAENLSQGRFLVAERTGPVDSPDSVEIDRYCYQEARS